MRSRTTTDAKACRTGAHRRLRVALGLATGCALIAIPIATLPVSDTATYELQHTMAQGTAPALGVTTVERDRKGRPIFFEARTHGADTRALACVRGGERRREAFDLPGELACEIPPRVPGSPSPWPP